MNRAVAIALAVLVPLMGFGSDLAPAGWAQVEEDPAEKQRRIDRFQEYRLIFEQPSPSPASLQDYSLRQGAEPIFDEDFVELMGDTSLTEFWLGERNRDYAFWLGTGVLAVPAGSLLFYQNFLGEGPAAPFSQPVPAGLPSPEAALAARQNVNDWRTFTLSVVGVALVSYGLYNLSLWLTEELDWRHPNRLDADSIAPRVREWNETLRTRLNLEPADIPSPPTPRPSVSPSTSPLPEGFTPPSPPVGGPDALPMGGPASSMPVPLPVLTPGEVPSELLPAPTPTALPSEFDFPGEPPAEDVP